MVSWSFISFNPAIMAGSHFFNWRLLMAIVFNFMVVYLCCERCQCYARRAKSLSYRMFNELGSGRGKSNNAAAQITLRSNGYNYCLKNIPIPNITLDTTFTPEQENAVLIEIFNKTGGENWKRKTHWGDPSVSHCFWYGITCDPTQSGYIISIFLSQNNLIGTLPGSLWMLRNLLGLCIGGNNGLLGNLRNILSANMTSILRVDLAFNKLSGQIPGELLVQMKSLVKIQLCCQTGQERLFGKIPKDIGNLTDLQVLSIGLSSLYGSIPESIGKLKKLWFLDLESAENLRSGFEHLLKLSSLRYMLISRAGLKGPLPGKFGIYFPAMIQCALAGNHFTGKIPSTMGNMRNLNHLNLKGNDFTGQIPKSIGFIPMLQFADFSKNRILSLEKGIQFKSRSLQVLILAENKQLTMLFDALLEVIQPLVGSLRILNISGCDFYGTIPRKLWNFQNLISLDLSQNRLSGQLSSPTGLMMDFLVTLDISVNNLSGQIPQISILSLKLLNISKNLRMHEADKLGPLPNFMKADFTTLSHRNPSDKFKCPNARLNYNNGLVVLDPSYYRYRLCICDSGYYGSEETCLPCMPGAVCKDHVLPEQKMVMKVGYWPSSRDQNVTHLVKCSLALGTSSYVNTPCNPSGTCDCSLKEGNKSNSKPSTICNNSCLCLKGSKDRFCSLCEDGYFKQGTLCYACPKTKTSVYILAALVVLTMVLLTLGFLVLYERKRFLSIILVLAQIILLVILAMYQKIPGWLAELNTVALFFGLAGRGKAARGILKISVFYVQTFDALISNTDVWPQEVLETQRYVSNVFNLRFSGLACEIPSLFTPLGELLSLMLLPVICIAGIWLYYGLGYFVLWFRKLLARHPRLRESSLQLSIVSLNLTFFPIVKKTASVLARCGEDNNFRYLVEAPWLECEGHVYTMLQGFGWLAFALYVIGVPFGVFLPLLWTNAAKREQMTTREQETLDSWLGSIYLPYKKEFRSYFEILFLLRRMLIAFSLSFIPRASSFRTIAVCFVLLASLCFQLLFKPFRDSYQKIALENSAETLVLLTLHFSFMNIRYAVLNPDSSGPIVWMLVVVNVAVLCSLILSIIVLIGRTHDIQIPPTVHQSEEDEEYASDRSTDAPLSPLIRNGPEEEYGTFDEVTQ